MILSDRSTYKLPYLLSKVDFGKKGYNAENQLHVLVAKNIAKHSDN